MKCDFCDSDGECFDGCGCSKCVNPERYEEWKENHPEKYEMWLGKKRLEDYE